VKPTSLLPRALPPGLEALAELAVDLRWTWSHAGDALWKRLDPVTWERTENPYVVLHNVPEKRLEELAKDGEVRAEIERLVAARAEYCASSWWTEAHAATAPAEATSAGTTSPGIIAYFSMEFGLGEALPLYAGGLGVLAGDHLKAASDLDVPLVGVGLLYQEGYFRQSFDPGGWQVEAYPYNDPTMLPVEPATSRDGSWLHVLLRFPGREVRFRVWEARVGRVRLYLLDSNDPLNGPRDRGITSKLYGGGRELRLLQEIALGIGGWRALEELSLHVAVCHLNEGHAAFAALERAHSLARRHGLSFAEALWAARAGNVFTTHTPVAAALDTFPPELLEEYGREYARELGLDPAEILALGRKDPGDASEPFNMAYLAARASAAINGVSRLHGEVSRRIFQALYRRWPEVEVPVTHVTNGVHVPSWDSPWADRLWTDACGKGRWLGGVEELSSAVEDVGDEALWTFACQERRDLVAYARRRLARQLGERGAGDERVSEAREVLDPNALTLGFARRFAEYKRPTLLLRDPERLARLLADSRRPAQLLVAGKAHPDDHAGKRLIQEWTRFAARPDVARRVVFLEDYDLALAQELVRGVDVWINTPRRPWEACGTSGMKVLANGGLNLSSLDGWWEEAYTEDVGWALPGSGDDADEAGRLYRLLENEVVPLFYARDASGVPRGWVKRMRASMARLAPRFSTNRMVREYVEGIYRPAAAMFHRRLADGGRLARELRAWEESLRRHWREVRIASCVFRTEEPGRAEVHVYLGGVDPEAVRVELYSDPLADGRPARLAMTARGKIPGALDGYRYECLLPPGRPLEHFTPRVVPHHPEAHVPAEAAWIAWGEPGREKTA
jgi:starch phosphorylase